LIYFLRAPNVRLMTGIVCEIPATHVGILRQS